MPFRYVFFGDKVTAKQQYKMLTRLFYGAPTASFGETAVIRSVGGYNEAIPMTEDGPLYLSPPKQVLKKSMLVLLLRCFSHVRLCTTP